MKKIILAVTMLTMSLFTTNAYATVETPATAAMLAKQAGRDAHALTGTNWTIGISRPSESVCVRGENPFQVNMHGTTTGVLGGRLYDASMQLTACKSKTADGQIAWAKLHTSQHGSLTWDFCCFSDVNGNTTDRTVWRFREFQFNGAPFQGLIDKDYLWMSATIAREPTPGGWAWNFSQQHGCHDC